MSTPLEGAIVAAQQARQDTQQVELIAAILAAQQATQTAAQPACHCGGHAPARKSSTGRLLAITGAVCACGAVATAMFLAVALTAVSVGISALVLYGLYKQVTKR